MVCPSCCYVRAVGCTVFHTIKPSITVWSTWSPVMFFMNLRTELVSCLSCSSSVFSLRCFRSCSSELMSCPVLLELFLQLMLHELYDLDWCSYPILNKLYDLGDGCPAMLEQGVALGMSASKWRTEKPDKRRIISGKIVMYNVHTGKSLIFFKYVFFQVLDTDKYRIKIFLRDILFVHTKQQYMFHCECIVLLSTVGGVYFCCDLVDFSMTRCTTANWPLKNKNKN